MDKGANDVARISQEPIAIPGNPFWIVLKRFGRDELVAAFVNVLGTALVACFSSNVLVLALAGPVIEKIGFFPAHFWEALGVYRTTPAHVRKRLSAYLKHALAGGFLSLVEDVLVHDPCYTLLMIAGLRAYPGAPVWLLAAGSFAAAVVIVSLLETSVTELRYLALKRRLTVSGFGQERYFEARFMISKAGPGPQEVISNLAKEFGMDPPRRLEYHDLYLAHRLGSYSGRKPKVRLRDRTADGGGTLRSFQVVYTRASEMVPRKFDQYRFFPIRKEKLYYPLEAGAPVPVFHPQVCGSEVIREVRFTRLVANNKPLLVSVDILQDDRPFYVLEMKTHRDVRTMVAAMRLVMGTLPVVQTTHGKTELLGAVD